MARDDEVELTREEYYEQEFGISRRIGGDSGSRPKYTGSKGGLEKRTSSRAPAQRDIRTLSRDELVDLAELIFPDYYGIVNESKNPDFSSLKGLLQKVRGDYGLPFESKGLTKKKAQKYLARWVNLTIRELEIKDSGTLKELREENDRNYIR